MRLKSDTRRADKEIEFYRDKVDMSDKLKKIEERRGHTTQRNKADEVEQDNKDDDGEQDEDEKRI